MSVAALLQAMHTTAHKSGGSLNRNATGWLTLAQRNDVLLEAFRVVYGSRLPTQQKLGQDLTSWVGEQHGELRVISEYSKNKKAFRYRIETAAETQVREQERNLKELKQDVIDDDKLVRASNRLFKAVEKEEEKKRDAKTLEQISSFAIHVAHAPPEEYLYEESKPDAQGNRTKTLVIDPRTGEPVKKEAAPVSGEWVAVHLNGEVIRLTKPPAESIRNSILSDGSYFLTMEEYQRRCKEKAAVQNVDGLPPWVGRNASGSPVLKRQPTHKELAARHHQREAPASLPRPAPGLPLSGAPGPSGMRVPVDDGSRDGWKYAAGDPNWTKKL
jgi:hypothetical protein